MRLKFLFPAIVLVHCNVTWLIVVWCFDLLPWLAAFLLVIFFPVFASVAVGLLVLPKIGDDLLAVVAAASILFPVVYGVSGATRMPDYVRFIHSGRDAFAGAVSEIESGRHLFYTLDDFLIKSLQTEDEFGVSYSSSRTRQSSTTYAKHFAVPVFDAKNADAPPRLWLCDTYKSGSLQSDNYDYSLYGFDRTSLSASLNAATLYGMRGGDDDCRRAAAQYLEKKNLAHVKNPLMLKLVGEPAEDYYRTARRHYWIMTAVLNLLFLGLSIYSLKKTGNL